MTSRTASEHFEANLVLTWHPITADPVEPVEVPLNEHIAWYPEELGKFRLSTRDVLSTADTTSTRPVTDWTSPHWDEDGYLLVWDKVAKQWRRAVPDPVERQPDAGTANCWTVVGGVEVHAYNGRAGGEPFGPRVVVGRPDSPVLVFTAHQARALAEVLPAAAAKCDEFEERSHG